MQSQSKPVNEADLIKIYKMVKKVSADKWEAGKQKPLPQKLAGYRNQISVLKKLADACSTEKEFLAALRSPTNMPSMKLTPVEMADLQGGSMSYDFSHWVTTMLHEISNTSDFPGSVWGS